MTSPYRAVVFDMDGVLVDSEPAFFDAVNDVLAQEGRSIDWERYQRLLGTSVEEIWRSIIAMLGIRGDAHDYVRRYSDVLLDCLRRPRPLLPGVETTISALKDRSVPIALATSSRQEWVEAALVESARLPIETFNAVVWRQMVERSKPAPDLYLKAAELLGVPAAQCIAVEDTPPGIAAAKAAGMYAVQSRASSTAFPPIAAADLVIDTLEYFPVAMVDSQR